MTYRSIADRYVTEAERHKWQTRYNANKDLYAEASDAIHDLLLRYLRRHPNVLRVVFSRTPKIKEFPSLVNKVAKEREIQERENGRYSYDYDNVIDLVAFTCLCPYRTDAKALIRWLREVFDVITPEDKALRETELGHRALHYVVQFREEPAHYAYRGIKFEIQIKTLLEEAFDAKTHNYTYKELHGPVDPELKAQFKSFSYVLKCIDEQSEFLRGLILSEELEMLLRRNAAIRSIVTQPTVLAVGENIQLDHTKLESYPIQRIVSALRNDGAKTGITAELCRYSALCALIIDDPVLRDVAIDFAEQLTGERRFLRRGNIKCVLKDFEGGLSDFQKSIRQAEEQNSERLLQESKANFVYFVTDMYIVDRIDPKEQNDWWKLAEKYEKELAKIPNKDPALLDTLGFFWIVFGDWDSINQGRQLVLQSKTIRQPDAADVYNPYFWRHEDIALRRLRQQLPPPGDAS